MRVFRLIVGVFVALAMAAAVAPAWLVPFRRVRDGWIRGMRRAWARFFLRLFRVRVRVEPPDVKYSGAAVYVANHTGYLDILVLMSLAPGVFISREGIVRWPIIGQLAALGGTLFVNRNDRLGVRRFVGAARERLRAGASIVFFPEATSSSGETLLPFRSSLFAAAASVGGESFPVRPFVLCYRSVGGRPLDTGNRDRVFWYGDMRLVGHLWRMLAAPGIEVVVKALPERTVSGDRREFARALRDEMLEGVEIPVAPRRGEP